MAICHILALKEGASFMIKTKYVIICLRTVVSGSSGQMHPGCKK